MSQTTYNNNTNTPLTTTTSYDEVGRVEFVYENSSACYTLDTYLLNGQLGLQKICDGEWPCRYFLLGYDGHDRLKTRTALGSPNLITTFTYDGLDRQVEVEAPKDNIKTRTHFDLAGRRLWLKEDYGMPNERTAEFDYNRLSQLITQATKNKDSAGNGLPDQVTTFRYDTLGRQRRVILPDNNTTNRNSNGPENCTDCIRMEYDDGGRMLSRTDQRGWVTSCTYDDRGLMLTQTTVTDTGTTLETVSYDAVGRMVSAQRGGSTCSFVYTGLGNLNSETQHIPGGTARTVIYGHDQAGNRTSLDYPGIPTLAYTHTSLNQVDTVSLNGQPLIDYAYTGHLLDKRRVTTSYAGQSTVYEVDWDYHDSRRWCTAITNTLEIAGNRQTVARHAFPLHDNNGNVLQQMADGLPQFAGDDREFQVNRLNQLIGTNYTTYGQTESVTLDAAGNLESRTDRTGTLTDYISPERPNAANEYRYIGGVAVQYDPAGNLSIDEVGRHYDYDEQNRLVEVRAADDTTVLAHYVYDALGRRIVATIGGVSTRYYYTGQQILEERDGSDARLRFHIPGCQYVDEQVATYTEATGRWEYYLLGRQFNVVGRGNADGSLIQAIDYGSGGDFTGSGAMWAPADFDHDGDIDRSDFMVFQGCITGEGAGPPALGCEDKDLDHDTDVDQDDFDLFQPCISGTWMPIDPACLGSNLPASGSFTMHGLMVDVLADGKALLYARARHYDLKHGRWLQRDPLGFIDGPNLYEAFGGNPLVNVDPMGKQFGYINSYPADTWVRMHQESSTFALPRGDLKKDVVGLFVETKGKTEEQYTRKFKEEVGYTAEGALVLAGSLDPQFRLVLQSIDPQLASALTPQANWELNVLGPAQGVANAAQGVQNIVVDLANLGIAGAKQSNVVLLVLIPDDVAITSPEWSRAVALRESDWVHNVTARLGGEAGFFLITVGLGELLTPTRAMACAGSDALAGEGELLAKVGKTTSIPLHDASTPWYRYLSPKYDAKIWVQTQGRTQQQIAQTWSHELQHYGDILNHPQITSLAAKKWYFPGTGLARYWMELRGYYSGGTLLTPLTPLRSFSTAQKLYLGLDIGIFGGGSGTAGYVLWDYANGDQGQ